MPLSNYLRNKFLDHVFGGVAWPALPASIYFALYTTTLSAADSGTEATGGSYARVAVTRNQTNFPAASAGAITNATAVTFPTPTADWGSIQAVGIRDANAAGNLLLYANLSSPLTVSNGTAAPTIPVGDLDWQAT